MVMIMKREKSTLYKSIVDNSIFSEFEEQRGICLFNHSENSNFIDDFISVAHVLCPNVIEVEGHVFIDRFFNCSEKEALGALKELKKQFNNDKKQIEQWVNAWSFGDFFIGKYSPSLENDKILYQFGDILVYYWTRRFKELFPDRNIIVEYGEDLMGETGPTIIVYEASE